MQTTAQRHEEAFAELKRLHREELEDVRRRSADSQTLETLVGQVVKAKHLKLIMRVLLRTRRG